MSAREVADAILYEGYLLYPYRASAQKNRSRWQFGVLMPFDYAAADEGESAHARTECVLEYQPSTRIEVTVRFLQVQRRGLQALSGGSFVDVDELVVGDRTTTVWEEAVEQELVVSATLGELTGPGVRAIRHIPGGEELEPICDGDTTIGRTARRRRPLEAEVVVSATVLDSVLPALRLRVGVTNRTQLRDSTADRREDAMPGAMVAVHMIMVASCGNFVSMVDPPGWAADAVRQCENVGCWPVLAGPCDATDTMLASPIILYDYPRIAPESPGNLFDATEIDEILTLRTLALTDSEKREARATDPRAAALLDRVESLDQKALDGLHGAIRFLRPVGDPSAPWWDPGLDGSVSPLTDTVQVGGVPVAAGAVVRLRPGARRADAQDMFLAGRLATVEAVLLDVDGRPYLAVTLADDPAADLQRSHGRFLYFGPDEVEVTG